ncbi:MAG TPA: SPOR domain-containing protein, partial [Candidatus Binatia bacterium]|nr:SPOR domain-containing protein [Candidatus Binatia bacterium]
EGALGGKTGYTLAAQKCFVGAVQRNGATLIVAILGARDQWGDTKRLLEYGFDHYDSLKTLSPSEKSVPIEPQLPRLDRVPSVVESSREVKQPNSLSGYILQLATFRERSRAELFSRQMSDQGFNVFVEPTLLSPGDVAYRVRIGPYSELLRAQETAQDILAKSGHQVLILPFQPARQEPSEQG